MKFGGGREDKDKKPEAGYNIHKWHDDEEDHPTITFFFGKYR